MAPREQSGAAMSRKGIQWPQGNGHVGHGEGQVNGEQILVGGVGDNRRNGNRRNCADGEPSQQSLVSEQHAGDGCVEASRDGRGHTAGKEHVLVNIDLGQLEQVSAKWSRQSVPEGRTVPPDAPPLALMKAAMVEPTPTRISSGSLLCCTA